MKILENKARIFKMFLQYLILILSPIATMYLLEFYTHNPFKTMNQWAHPLNIVFFELVMLFFLFLMQKARAALITQTVLTAFIGLANYYVLQFRSAPIMPWDIYSLRTAASVANSYNYDLSKNAVIVLVLFVVLILLEACCSITLFPDKKKKNFYWKKYIGAGVLLLLLIGFTKMLHQEEAIRYFRLYDKLFTPTTMSRKDGTIVAFLMELKFLSVEKPSGYSDKEAEELLASYEQPQQTDQTPNIIVIMDEAFSDPQVLGMFQTNQDYMPYIRSLVNTDNTTVAGKLHVSVLGGNTANTEFEYLTGSTMAFLPQGSIPYQQYIKSELPSMASHLKSLGYQTVAMHPYHAKGWERNQVYPWLGIDKSYFLDDFAGAGKVRDYVSDAANFDKIIDIYENKGDTPLFLFNVTMQNHSPYTAKYDDFKQEIVAEGLKSEALDQYLSLLKLTDDAVRDLLTYFEAQEEETVVVFFGDHQTTNSVIEPILRLNGKKSSELTEEEEALRYTVPFFIWSNKGLQGENGLELSVNYLGMKTLEAAGLPLPKNAAFLQELSNQYPVITPIQVRDIQGNRFALNEKKDELAGYETLQYYMLFGR